MSVENLNILDFFERKSLNLIDFYVHSFWDILFLFDKLKMVRYTETSIKPIKFFRYLGSSVLYHSYTMDVVYGLVTPKFEQCQFRSYIKVVVHYVTNWI